MTLWDYLIAIAIGFVFVLLSNRKVVKKLKDYFKQKEKEKNET